MSNSSLFSEIDSVSIKIHKIKQKDRVEQVMINLTKLYLIMKILFYCR